MITFTLIYAHHFSVILPAIALGVLNNKTTHGDISVHQVRSIIDIQYLGTSKIPINLSQLSLS